MNNEEKLDLIEEMLKLPEYILKEDTTLDEVDGWDSLAITNFQMELAVKGKEVPFEELRACERVVELFRYID